MNIYIIKYYCRNKYYYELWNDDDMKWIQIVKDYKRNNEIIYKNLEIIFKGNAQELGELLNNLLEKNPFKE